MFEVTEMPWRGGRADGRKAQRLLPALIAPKQVRECCLCCVRTIQKMAKVAGSLVMVLVVS